MDDRVELLYRRLERERRARKDAEIIIEGKSRELYIKNKELEHTAAAERQARSEAEVLRSALESFTSKLDRDEVLTQLEAFVKSLIPHDASAVYFFDGEDLRLHSVRGDSKESKVTGEVITPTVLLSDIKRSSHPILIADNISDGIASEWRIPADTGTWLAVPMSAHGQNIGCLTLASRQRGAFSESATKLAQALANEAAIALENARLFQEVERLSTVDPLTGLHNRRQFNATAWLEFERSVRHNLPLSAIMADIDRFKRVNDTYGHAVGDTVLVEVAAACMRGLRSSDIHVRYGGEEFCFLLPHTDLNEAYALGERLRLAVAELQFEADGQGFTVTASFGVAERLEGEKSVESLIERSDQAMYAAKGTGRNQVIKWQPSWSEKFKR